MKRKLLLCAVALWSAAAFALPTSQAVQDAVKAGNYTQAESMMQEVVTAKPQSAKAHYVYAEILAHDAKFDEAARQAKQAEMLDPAIGFTDPEKFRSFEKTLQREQAAPAPTAAVQPPVAYAPAQQAGTGLPGWVWGAGVALIAFLIFRAVTRRAAMQAPAGAAYANGGLAPQAGYGGGAGYGQPGYGQPGYGQPGYGGAPGGGLLRTGLAAAGGLAAGMLVEKMIDDHRGNDYNGDRSGMLGGTQPGMFDSGSGQAATELEQRPIDFGSGNDWGGDASSGGDFTPSGDDGGGGW